MSRILVAIQVSLMTLLLKSAKQHDKDLVSEIESAVYTAPLTSQLFIFS